MKMIITAALAMVVTTAWASREEMIRASLTERLPMLRQCYQQHLEASGRDDYGIVTLDFTLNRHGDVSNIQLSGNDLPLTVKQCVAEMVSRVRFQGYTDDITIDVSQEINFSTR